MDQIKSTNSSDAVRKPSVSVVIPAYNEAAILEKNLGVLCDYMKGLEADYNWELIIVNDGSTDETGDIVDAFAKSRDNVTGLHHMFNFRLGQALRYAFNNCQGDIVVVMDSDLSYSPDHIGRMLAKMKESRAKIVIASPYVKGGKVSNVPWLRKIMSVWANRFIAFFARDRYLEKLTTITGMVRAYDRVFLSKLNLKAMDMDINPEIIYKGMILRARIVEIPAHLDWVVEKGARKDGKARKSNMRILRSILASIISGFIFRPFMFFFLPGVALLFISLYPLAWVFIHTFTFYAKLAGSNLSFSYRLSGAIGQAFMLSPHAFVVSGLAMIISLQLMTLGILALQNKRYFEEMFHLGSSIYRSGQDKQQRKSRRWDPYCRQKYD
jgi:glycosyltransferase involved in cell wall biosynthesis